MQSFIMMDTDLFFNLTLIEPLLTQNNNMCFASHSFLHLDHIFGIPDKKGSYDSTFAIMSVDEHIFSKMAYRVFLKLLMKLRCLKGKKNDRARFLGKNLILGIMPKNTPKIGFFWILQKKYIVINV